MNGRQAGSSYFLAIREKSADHFLWQTMRKPGDAPVANQVSRALRRDIVQSMLLSAGAGTTFA